MRSNYLRLLNTDCNPTDQPDQGTPITHYFPNLDLNWSKQIRINWFTDLLLFLGEFAIIGLSKPVLNMLYMTKHHISSSM